jgi:hypothetical protein
MNIIEKMTTRANTTSHSEWATSPDKSFISTRAFNTELYQYSVSRSDRPPFTTTGTLVVHASASAAQCPAGRVLHANGKRLIPDVNVMNSFTSPAGTTIQAKKFMLGVYDPESMLNGFIDPTSPTFAVYDKNRPASDYLIESTSATAEATALLGLGGQGSRLPAKLLVGNPATAVAAGASSAGTFTVTGFSITNQLTATLATVASTSVTANSLIFLTSAYPGKIVLAIGTVVAGTSFQVRITNVGITPGDDLVGVSIPVNWLILN